jgi:hypothetical protein
LAVDAGDPREQRRRKNRQRADQHARRNEEAARIFQVLSQHVVTIRAFGMNAQRQPHQRIERR